MDVEPIRTRADYRAALKRIQSLMNAKSRTSEGGVLDPLVVLVQVYQRAKYPMKQTKKLIKQSARKAPRRAA